MFYLFSNLRTVLLIVFSLSFIVLGIFFFTFFLILIVPILVAFYFYRKYFLKSNLRDYIIKESYENKKNFIDAEFKKNDDERET